MYVYACIKRVLVSSILCRSFKIHIHNQPRLFAPKRSSYEISSVSHWENCIPVSALLTTMFIALPHYVRHCKLTDLRQYCNANAMSPVYWPCPPGQSSPRNPHSGESGGAYWWPTFPPGQRGGKMSLRNSYKQRHWITECNADKVKAYSIGYSL